MDIFSGIKNIQNKSYENVSNVNIHKNKLQEVKEVHKDELNKKSKEEIEKELQKVIKELNEAMNPLNNNLEFKYNKKVDELVVQVIDKKDNKIIREFPPKEALKLMEKMRELVGMLFDKKG